MRILFMGTPEFAAASLDHLVKNKIDVAGVITSVDKPSGRGRHLIISPVKKYALENNLKILQPDNLKNPDFIKELKKLDADVFVVVAFRMLPEVVWSIPRKGCFNLHASLLPQYRGAAPINRAIMNGEKETGLTCFFINKEIDTGKIINQVKTNIYEDETAGSLHNRLMIMGADLVLNTLNDINTNNIKTKSQEDIMQNMGLKPQDLKSAPKIFKENCKINWEQDMETIFNHIRGLNPHPGAFTELNGLQLKIFSAEKTDEKITEKPGCIKTDGKSYIYIAASNGYISLKDIQLEGKKRMSAEDFLRGYRLTV